MPLDRRAPGGRASPARPWTGFLSVANSRITALSAPHDADTAPSGPAGDVRGITWHGRRRRRVEFDMDRFKERPGGACWWLRSAGNAERSSAGQLTAWHACDTESPFWGSVSCHDHGECRAATGGTAAGYRKKKKEHGSPLAIKLCSFSMTPVCIGSQNRIGFLQVTSWVYPAEKLISSAKGIAAMALE